MESSVEIELHPISKLWLSKGSLCKKQLNKILKKKFN